MEADGSALSALVLRRLHAARRAGDLRLAGGGRRLPAHSALLCALSPALARACATRTFSPRRPLTVALGRCGACLEALLSLLYGQPAPLPRPPPAHAPHLHRLAERLRLPPSLRALLPPVPPAVAPPTARRLACKECGRLFASAALLVRHARAAAHAGRSCSLCAASFASRAQLLRHLTRHDHAKPFFCAACDARFRTRALLHHHLPKHSQQAPFACPLCHKGFKWKHGLNSHLSVHSNEKKHLCDECGFGAVHAKTMRAHKLSHSGDLFRCSFAGCSHACSRKENMKLHLLTHSKDKPFVCEVCGLKFSLNKSLKRHGLLHGDVVHKCSLCPFKAVRADNLKAHISRQHAEKPTALRENLRGARPTTRSIVENDLIVLADAASSRPKIREPTNDFDHSQARNFDRLTANP